MDGITLSTTSDTSDVTTLDDLDSEVPLLTRSEEASVVSCESSSPSILLPIIFEVRNTALDTTPKSTANPTTATAFGNPFFGFLSSREGSVPEDPPPYCPYGPLFPLY